MDNKTHSYNKQEQQDCVSEVDSKRRSFLKYIFFGGAVFMLGKIFGPSINIFSSNKEVNELNKTTNFENFRVVEAGKELQFFDKMGNEILSLDKEK